MTPVPLHDDIEALAAACPAARPIARRLQVEAPARRPGLVVEAAGLARLDPAHTLALLLKEAWEAQGCPSLRWRPWHDAAHFAALLPALRDGGEANGEAADDGGLVLRLLELCAQYGHIAGLAATAELTERNAHQRAVLAAAGRDLQRAFTRDKQAWLEAELQFDELVDLRQQLVDEIASTRLRYLVITGAAATELVEAAHRLALAHYRLAFDDPTMTPEEVEARLSQDLGDVFGDGTATGPLAGLEAELRLALQDSVCGIHGDQRTLRRIATLVRSGLARPASDEEIREATLLFRRLARLCHPDLLPRDAVISPDNRARLDEIWLQSSATHDVRVQLSHDKLVSYVQNLQGWMAEAERIWRAFALPAPTRVLEGATLAELRADLARANADAQRHLHVMRDEVSTLEFDPLHLEYRRIIAMAPEARDAECTRMRERAARWRAEADRLQLQIDARAARPSRPPRPPAKPPGEAG